MATELKAEEKQIQCIAEAIYHEANSEPEKGKIAVGNVVMNRVEDKRYPKTPCSVVHQRSKKSCQFSWVCTSKKIRGSMKIPLDIARRVYYRNISDNTNGALFFHNRSVRPSWAKLSRRTTVIGHHSFYR